MVTVYIVPSVVDGFAGALSDIAWYAILKHEQRLPGQRMMTGRVLKIAGTCARECRSWSLFCGKQT
jgi:hypothetical protein